MFSGLLGVVGVTLFVGQPSYFVSYVDIAWPSPLYFGETVARAGRCFRGKS